MGRIIGYLLLAIVVLGVGFYLYQRNIAAVPVVASDLDKGGAYSDAEKASLKSACADHFKTNTDKVCGCVADKVGAGFSRFDRMILTATMQEKLADIVGITKGLIASGIDPAKMKSAESDSRQRVTDLIKTCNPG